MFINIAVSLKHIADLFYFTIHGDTRVLTIALNDVLQKISIVFSVHIKWADKPLDSK